MTDPYYEVVDTSKGQEGWNRFRDRFSRGRPNAPLERIIQIARSHRVRAVLVEPFIDPHYRDEYSHFFSTLFRRPSATCQRLHFFTRSIPASLRDLRLLQPHYRGYSVMRPIPSHPVGRTMIVPPYEVLQSRQSVVCAAEETVHPYGYALTVTGMPFINSDGSYLACGHAVQWMVLNHAHLAHGLPRRLPAEIHEASMGGAVAGRQVPTEGLSQPQILSSLQGLRMPAGMVKLPDTAEESATAGIESLFATLCRHVNSQFPPIVVSEYHAWVVVGYEERTSPTGARLTRLYVHDDLAGPYVPVDDPWGTGDDRGAWEWAIPALPERLLFDAEAAESTGTAALQTAARDEELPAEAVAEASRAGALDFRAYAIRSHQYKAELENRLPKDIELAFRATRMPGTVWVVEAIDRRLYAAGEPCVLGEAVLDTTAENPADPSTQNLSAVIAFHVAGVAIMFDAKWTADNDDMIRVTPFFWANFKPYPSGLPRRGLALGRTLP